MSLYKLNTDIYKDSDMNVLLTYSNNSCYFDSAIIALFHPLYTNASLHTLWFYKSIFKQKLDNHKAEEIQHEIKNIISNSFNIHTHQICRRNTSKRLRNMFQNYDAHYNKIHIMEWTMEQNDPTDVIYMLEYIFNIPNKIKFKNNENIERSGLIGLSVPVYLLMKNVKFEDLFPNFVDSETKIKRKFVKGSMLYVQVHRNFMDSRKITSEFKPPVKIHDMTLVSIIIHIGSFPTQGHYVTLFKQNNSKWIYYDNMDLNVKYVDNTDIFTFNSNIVTTNGVGFLYAKN